MSCAHCGGSLPEGSRRDRLYCHKNCSQLAYLARRRSGAPPLPRWRHPALDSQIPLVRAAAARAKELSEVHGMVALNPHVRNGRARAAADRPRSRGPSDYL
jgi:hypothetical protein